MRASPSATSAAMPSPTSASWSRRKEAAEDEAHRAEDDVQKLTDRRVAEVDSALAAKEADLMEV